MVRRANDFEHNEFARLVKARQTFSLEAANRRAAGQDQERFPGDDDGKGPTQFLWHTESWKPSPTTASGAAQHVRRGFVSKGNNALQAVVVETGAAALAALRDLHPQTAAVMPFPPTASTAPKPVATGEVLRALRSFKPGSSGGIDPLTPSLLRELVEAPASQVLDSLALLATRIAQGWDGGGARNVLFGARLTALGKKGGGVRPIAVDLPLG